MGDTLLASSLYAARLPSPSVLTGNYAPQTAGMYVEQALQESQRRAAGSRLGTPAAGGSRGNPEEVGTLRSLAARHLGSLGRGMGPTAYPAAQRPFSPKQPPPGLQLSQQLLQPPRSTSTPPLRCHTPVLLSGEPLHREGRGGGGGGGMAAATGIQSSLPRLVVPNADPAGPSAGPAAGFFSPQHAPSNAAAAAAAAAAGTAAGTAAAADAPSPGVRFAGAAAAASSSSRPATALSVQDLNLSSRPGSRMGPPPGTPPSRSHLATGSSSFSATGRSSTQPGHASPLRGGYRHTVTKRLMETSPAAAAAAEANRLGGFRVTRGMLYSVFQELDEFDSGRLTYSAFEQAACRIGMRSAQARRLFDQLDPEGQGYTTVRRWVDPVVERQMEQLVKLYVQATRGEDGRPKHVKEVGNMHIAVQLAMNKLQLKRCGRAVSIERLVDAFRFIDRDASGALSAEELEDALNALGIFVTREVLETMMRTFDKDGNGGVDYLEFVHSLFPNEATNISSSTRAH
ncbi:hypothetical protein HYH02_002050 [Chlamydomonas schloesseri]|uniref:EF-hand domain-containing protein n=1 Tax=Chlamydomonas schloesseri TaxID=2026947 RepID=A0A835WV75_9CHLO|nr:hypothetical protein HYH02_002050 [Chlamydomonas schloesseri]|eukprot:KAG2453843.1 hypothetical protein HYH02_002050 [Chlamydomonas schloesseri]